ncbi:hypothetical protein ATANTOWER_028089 [Ataeniobius toweri]|uniref:Uncharacterized protein n=1 Tax=Ataeniobius toweri TaxID=208326 RepID=A0ABU7ASC5_9TELE|nr:hypothetical protein [Ataeniobius toweri]
MPLAPRSLSVRLRAGFTAVAGSWCPGGRFVSQRGAADLRTGSWIDGSTAEIDRHPDAAPGVKHRDYP